MKADSQQPSKEREAVLNATIEAMDLAKASSILPAKAAFSSVTILLTTIRVCFLLSRNDLLHEVQTWPGLNDQRTGLRRARAILRRRLSNVFPGDEWKETGRAEPIRVRCDKSIDVVS